MLVGNSIHQISISQLAIEAYVGFREQLREEVEREVERKRRRGAKMGERLRESEVKRIAPLGPLRDHKPAAQSKGGRNGDHQEAEQPRHGGTVAAPPHPAAPAGRRSA